MIIYRIYTTGSFRDDFRLGMSGMVPVIVVLAESGALYTSGIIAFLCTYIAGSNGQYPALDIITPLIVGSSHLGTWYSLTDHLCA